MQNRLVTVFGIHGIGKTTLVKAATFYIDERMYFKDGIIQLSLRGVDQVNMVITRLYLLISKHLPVIENKKEELENIDNLLDIIIEFLKKKHLLIVLDNIEDII